MIFSSWVTLRAGEPASHRPEGARIPPHTAARSAAARSRWVHQCRRPDRPAGGGERAEQRAGAVPGLASDLRRVDPEPAAPRAGDLPLRISVPFCSGATSTRVPGSWRSAQGPPARTMALLRAVGPDGEVTSDEIRRDFFDMAQAKIRQFHGDAANWSLKLA